MKDTGIRPSCGIRRSSALAALALGCALAAPAGAAVPRIGSSSRAPAPPIRIAGVVNGVRFTAVSAVAQRDFYGELNVYFFGRRRGCGAIGPVDRPFVWLSVDTNKGRVVANLGRPIVTRGISVRMTRTGLHGQEWRGRVRLDVPASPRTRFAGSFVARSCASS